MASFAAFLFPHILVPVLQVLFFTLPPFPLRRAMFGAGMAALAYPCLFAAHASAEAEAATRMQNRYGLSVLWMYCLYNLAKMLLHDPEHDFWRDGHAPREAEHMPLGRAKLGWAAGLLSSHRGVGWNVRARGVPAPAPVGRWRFVLRQLVRVVWMYAALDAVCAFPMRMHFRDLADSIAKLGLLRILGLECAAGLQSYLANNWLFNFWGAVFVGTGVMQEKDWPPFYGPFSSITNLRTFWGKFWHQNMQLMLVDYGEFACRVLRVQPRSKVGRLVIVWIAFLISGSLHALANWTLPAARPFNGFYERFTSLFIFFVLQAVGVTIEDVAFSVLFPREDRGARTPPSRTKVLVGRTWAAFWLLLTGRFALETWLKTAQGMMFVPSPLMDHFAAIYEKMM
jgi:hypothetical protein